MDRRRHQITVITIKINYKRKRNPQQTDQHPTISDNAKGVSDHYIKCSVHTDIYESPSNANAVNITRHLRLGIDCGNKIAKHCNILLDARMFVQFILTDVSMQYRIILCLTCLYDMKYDQFAELKTRENS